jgi:dihydroorotase
MPASLLIRNATVIFPSGRAVANVLVDHGKIVTVDAAPSVQAHETIDATGMVLFPGLIDDQVHFREPGLTHKEDLHTASQACAAGGVTSFLEMPNTKPSATTQELIEAKVAIAADKSIVNFGFYIGATTRNVSDLKSAKDVPGIKIFIGSSTGDLLVDDQPALEQIFAETTLPICAHCEDETTVKSNQSRLGPDLKIEHHSQIRDERAAVIATTRALDLAKRHKHRFHVLHVSTAAELPLIREHGDLITSELCPHHWHFHVGDYERLGSLVQMNPSIKTAEDNKLLWQGLLDGDIQVVATDHAPHTIEEKQQPYPKSPSGLPAVENYFSLLLDRAAKRMCTWEQIASWTSDAPARVWGMIGKGRIEVGYDADLVLVDPNQTKTIQNHLQFTKSKWSPWDGVSLQGWPIHVWVAGRTVFRAGRIATDKPGSRLRFDHARGGYWKTTNGIGV